MFRITRKADYAVFILSYLARRTVEEGRDALVSAQELASFSSLNKSLVANLLKDLTRAGFLGSVRGARGGYRLARAAREISLAQILHAVEGPFSFVECAQELNSGLAGGGSGGVEIGAGEAGAADVPGHDVRPGEIAAPSEPEPTLHDSCNLSGLCQSKGPLLVLHMRIQQLLDKLSLSELAGIDQPAAATSSIPAEMFPSRLSGIDRNGGASRPPIAAGPAGRVPAESKPADTRQTPHEETRR